MFKQKGINLLFRLILGMTVIFVFGNGQVFGSNISTGENPSDLLNKNRDGKIKVFSTKNIPVQTKLNLTLNYPENWVVGNVRQDPHFKNSFSLTIGSPENERREWLSVICTEMPGRGNEALPNNILKKRFSPDELKKRVKEEERFVEAKSLTVSGVPAGLIEKIIYPNRNNNNTFLFQERSIDFWVGPNSIRIALKVKGENGVAELSRYMATARPVFDKIVASIVLPDVNSYQAGSEIELMFNYYRGNDILWIPCLVLLAIILVLIFCWRFFFRWLRG